MTNEELAAIEARAVEATPGNWAYITNDDGFLLVASANENICGFGDMEDVEKQDFDNARFVAYARDDIPVLITEVRRLQDALNEMMEFNPLRNDRDAYLLAVAEWGLKGKWGVDEEFIKRPKRAEFGLE